MEPIDHLIRQESRDQLTGAIQRLPETERMVFRMIAVEGFSAPDTAQCIAMPRAKVRKAMERAQAMLRARLSL